MVGRTLFAFYLRNYQTSVVKIIISKDKTHSKTKVSLFNLARTFTSSGAMTRCFVYCKLSGISYSTCWYDLTTPID